MYKSALYFLLFVAPSRALALETAVGSDNDVASTVVQNVDIAELAKALPELKVSIDDATAAANSAATAAEAASAKVSGLETQKILSSGISAGAAVALQSPIGSEQVGVAGVVMPYVVVLPAYWTFPEATRTYCASHWSSGDETDAQQLAITVSEKRASLLFDKALASITAGLAEDDRIVDLYFSQAKVKNTYEAKLVAKAIREWSVTTQDGAQRKAIVSLLAALDWNPSRVGECGWTKFGLWMGKPLNYEVGTEGESFLPAVAFGGAIVPNSYVSFLLGATVGSFRQDSADTGSSPGGTAWAATFAVGGNLDILGALF